MPSQMIDLFDKKAVIKEEGIKAAAVSPDSAFKYSTLSGTAAQIKIIDSSAGSTFYLYSAFVKSIDKGAAKNYNGKTYFIAGNKLSPLSDTDSYRFYFVPVMNNNIIKNNLAIKWQWYAPAPFIRQQL